MKLKKIIAGLLISAVAVTALPQICAERKAVFADEVPQTVGVDSDYEYEELDDGTLCLTKYNGAGGEVIVPSMIDGKTVTKIGDSLFENCKSILTVTISNGITLIGNNAFRNCTSLTLVEIPKTVTSIPFSLKSDVFHNCESLKQIIVDDENSVYSSVDGVLYTKEKTSIQRYPIGKEASCYEIINSVTIIPRYAFSGCTSLSSVKIPDGVTTIGAGAFLNCTSLNDITIPNSVEKIDSRAFANCFSLNSITIPYSVKELHGAAFDNCTSLIEINVDSGNENYMSVDGVLFNQYSKDWIQLLQYPIGKKDETYEIPEYVAYIRLGAFSKCTALIEINVNNNNKDYTSEDGIVFTKDKTNLIRYPAGKKETSYVISSNVTGIWEYAFEGSINLTSVTIPVSVTNIEYSVFENFVNDFVIYGELNSAAEIYANQNNIKFVNLKTISATNGNTGIEIVFDSQKIAENVILNTEENVEESTDSSIAYNITLTSDGKETQPSGSVYVKIPVPNGFNGEECMIFRKEMNGNYSDMKATFIENYLIFTTDHFSEYIVTSEKLLPDTLLGDVNGDNYVNDRDSILLDRYLAEWGSEVIIASSDMNGDGKVNDQDSIILARTLAGWYD